ncbi:MAG: hypothetical protein GY805_13785 [Chloroflexi bacterium]|nr:hypothetical protein [Chloroflexota bacterium]
MSVLNNKHMGRHEQKLDESLIPRAVILIILSIIGTFAAIYLAKSFLLENGIVVFGLIVTAVGSLALAQER